MLTWYFCLVLLLLTKHPRKQLVLVSFFIAVIRHYNQGNLQKSLLWIYSVKGLEFIMSLSMEAGREAQGCGGAGTLHLDHKHEAVSATGNGVSLLKAQSSTQ